jgi:hypothetical protein
MVSAQELARWEFDKGSGSIAYDIVNDYDGEIFGTSWVGGVNDSGLHFNGNDYIKVDDFPKLTKFTISLWINFNEVYSQKRYCGVIFSGTSNNEWGLRILDGIMTFVVSNGTDKQSWEVESLTEENYPVGWHHVVLMSNNETLFYYKNASLVDSHVQEVNNSGSPMDLWIGRSRSTSSLDYYFNGILDGIRIYNRTLSIREIEDLRDFYDEDDEDDEDDGGDGADGTTTGPGLEVSLSDYLVIGMVLVLVVLTVTIIVSLSRRGRQGYGKNIG